ncbi:hypothetical protein A2W45_03375 [Candidatus Curtissbacteria bacterium RIFCSPHIGHO2_12_41_11]|uniref:Uncharacterized protein n=3 Tax=Candidatus Curtissiibacteriota TaxID=1752717 RepID=A0A1F5HUT0_9BACT|nr:MAG: hypothetical protein UU56_C0002G0020 [Candidatus Curtissbacteria bacterium GW2011_GWA2_41_24]OGE00291.1 MAG: hypothetical protein A2W45_03375 [Candidatus Curtissbacteria bacterium RIFCSPHIGHO2_12_41_11]OGE07816.1 MAG: hypothetical protein A2W70_02890 [Candidatus Curtissbacteria bacterium RIFCSPLOWO2_02_41_11]
MKSSLVINRLAKYLVILILIASFLLVLFWLWQRQPKITKENSQNLTTPQTNQEEKAQEFIKNPKDNSILASNKVNIEGQADPDGYVAILASTDQAVVITTSDGQFSKEIELGQGLNLVEVISILPDFKQDKKQTLTLLVSGDKSQGAVFAGTVKSIFDTYLTITTPTGQKNLRSQKSTNIILPPAPKDQEEATSPSGIKAIRVGDYLIAEGEISSPDEMTTTKIEVLREDKPQNNKKLMVGRILVSPRQNLFSVKDITNSEITEFALFKNTQITKVDKEAKPQDLTKDANAIIIYHQDGDKNLVDLIYLLP